MSKPSYRQSNIYNFFSCPKKYELSTQYQMQSTLAMEDGRLFEAMVLGPKCEDEMKSLSNSRRAKTMDSFSRATEHIKKIFNFEKGESYKKLEYETADWVLNGEADWIGEVTILGKTYRTIADLKFTGSISKIWMEKSEKKDFLQAPFYQMMHYLETKEMLPFTYITVENIKALPEGALPLVKPFVVMPTKKSFEWVINLVESVHSQKKFEPNLNACEEGPFRTKCKYLYFCEQGRQQIEYPVEVNWGELEG